VARLVVDRKTNSQIAAELFLSKKTVETHLRNIFGKLEWLICALSATPGIQ
jgi:DNA-binding CsgD family transcriptional regulator